MEDTSWEKGALWYDSLTAKTGHYYHNTLIFPKLKQLMKIGKTSDPSILDIGCGQGVVARALFNKVPYLGLDNSKSLISLASKYQKNAHHKFIVQDATIAYPLNKKFSHVIFLLSLQNMSHPERAILQASSHLRPSGMMILVLNHPCFRVPRHSSWGVNLQQKIQYRCINRYSSPLEVPIQIHPRKKDTDVLWTFHLSLTKYFEYISKVGLSVTELQEWYCPKISIGKNAKMENVAREEFPLFLTIVVNPFHRLC